MQIRVLINVTVQTIFRFVSDVTIPKTICRIEWDILIVMFKRLAAIPNVALLNCAADGI